MATRDMILAGLFAALISISSQITLILPFSPVPHTLQIFFVMLAGLILGGRWGATSVAVWILLGVFGVPVFAQGKVGLFELVGPTGGYKIGFMLCAYLVGKLTEKANCGVSRTLGAMSLGLVTIYVLGFGGLMAHFAYFQHKPLTLTQGLGFAVLPFVPYDILKTLLASYLGVKIKIALMRAGLTSNR